MAKEHQDASELTHQEIAERMERALKRSFTMGHQPHQPSASKAPKSKTRPPTKGRAHKGKGRA